MLIAHGCLTLRLLLRFRAAWIHADQARLPPEGVPRLRELFVLASELDGVVENIVVHIRKVRLRQSRVRPGEVLSRMGERVTQGTE